MPHSHMLEGRRRSCTHSAACIQLMLKLDIGPCTGLTQGQTLPLVSLLYMVLGQEVLYNGCGVHAVADVGLPCPAVLALVSFSCKVGCSLHLGPLHVLAAGDVHAVQERKLQHQW